MRVLIIGSDGFIGKNLKYFLNDRGIDYLEHNKDNNKNISSKINDSDFIIHLADKIKSKKKNDFNESLAFTKKIISIIQRSNKKKYLIYTSSKNLNVKKNLHYDLKRKSEKILRSNKYIKTFILRLPNVFGKWCKPNYNSYFATACHNISLSKKIKINSKNKFFLIHVSDVCEYILKIIQNKKTDKEYFEKKFIKLSPIDIRNIIVSFKNKENIDINKKYKLTKNQTDKLFSTYLYYDNKNNFFEIFKKIKDSRGDFAELIKDKNFGQVSVLTVNPYQTRGNHFHNDKIEKFFVVAGQGNLIHQNILNRKKKVFRISENINKVYSTIPGWSHKIVNNSQNKLIILIYANEVYNKNKSDTIYWNIK